ncbi:MAG: SPFH domain-containing protein [Candidatus Bathyarchaeia archaeon]
MPQVIEWTSAGPEDIVWRYPAENIMWGAQLIVHEYEKAVFFRDGKSYDTFGPGRHTLTTLNLPLLTDAFSRVAGFTETPFKAAVVFISMKQFAGKFGNRAQTTELAPLMTFGSFWLKVESPELFVNEAVGGQSAYTTPSVNDFIRGFINERMIDDLSKYDLVTVFTKLDETSGEVKASLVEAFRRIGLQLVDLKFEGVDTTPEYRERLFWLKQGRMAPEEVLRMETVKEAAKELGKSSGAALGTGMVLIPPLFQTPSSAGAPTVLLVVCPSCNAQIPSTSKFCPNCGKGISAMPAQPSQVPAEKCKKCGEILPTGAKFCHNCGTTV